MAAIGATLYDFECDNNNLMSAENLQLLDNLETLKMRNNAF